MCAFDAAPWARAQSKETEKLIRKNDKLVADNNGLKRELSLHEQTEEEFARKVHVYQKTIKTLLAKLNSMDSVKRGEVERQHHEEEERERERAEGQQTIEAMEAEAAGPRRSAAVSSGGVHCGTVDGSQVGTWLGLELASGVSG